MLFRDRDGKNLNLLRRDIVLSPDARDPQSLLRKSPKMLASAGVGHTATDFMQKSAKYTAYGSCAVDEIVRAYAWFHKRGKDLVP